MKDAPNLWEFIKVNYRAQTLTNINEPLIYQHYVTGELFIEDNAKKSRLWTTLSFALFSLALYFMYKITPQFMIWNHIDAIGIVLIFAYITIPGIFRYFFTDFIIIDNELDAEGTGYSVIDLMLYISTGIFLLSVISYISDSVIIIPF